MTADAIRAGGIRIGPGDPASAAFLRLHEALDRELGKLYPADNIYSPAPEELDAPGSCLLLARDADGEAVGCGALHRLDATCAEVKRMYVAPEARGLKLGRRLLEALETRAVDLGYEMLRLEMGARQPPAQHLYVSFGFRRISCWDVYAYDPHSVCYEKRLTPP